MNNDEDLSLRDRFGVKLEQFGDSQTLAGKPPQGHDAKCGAARHTLAASKDYILTAYPKR